MAKFLQQGASNLKHPPGPSLLEKISWDDLRAFVVVAHTLSYRKAATALRTSATTVLRKIERLEDLFGFRLFDRVPAGLALTAEGQSVYRSAQEMERASHSLRSHLDQDLTTRGMVRCSVTEGLGTAWILPHLAQFSRTHPSTIVDLRCSMEVADVLRMEADVSVQIERPSRADVKAVRLGRMHIYPYVSRRYAELYGLPKSADDFARHRLIDQRAPQVDEEVTPRLLNLPNIEGIVALRTNASTAHAFAIELGIGIGGLPTYFSALGTNLIPLDIGVRHQVHIWMTYHPDVRSIRRVSIFIDWLRSLFDAKRYPWFGDKFIHPNEFAKNTPVAKARTFLDLPIEEKSPRRAKARR